MTHIDNTSLYEADDGKMFVRISDGTIMGDGLDLGVADAIYNYEEREFTEEERAAFWKSIGMDDPKKLKEPKERKEDRHEA
jgi:hypothetical protein